MNLGHFFKLISNSFEMLIRAAVVDPVGLKTNLSWTKRVEEVVSEKAREG